ncbi:MAG: hypothetical protein AAB660_02715 [Patescibacteria group bacterium]
MIGASGIGAAWAIATAANGLKNAWEWLWKFLFRFLPPLGPAIVMMMMAKSASAQTAEIGLFHRYLQRGDSSRTITTQDYLKGFGYLGSRCGVWGFGYHESGYSSGTIGPFCDIIGTFGIGVAGGAERLGDTRQTFGRYAVDVYIGDPEQCSLEVYYENGPSREYWYEVNGLCHAGRYVSLGVLSQRFAGTGLQAALRLGKTPLEIFGAGFYVEGQSRPNLMAGVQFVLQKHKR